MNNDLISREALKKEFGYTDEWYKGRTVCAIIDNAPTALHDNYSMGYQDGVRKVLSERPTWAWKRKDIEYAIETSACTFHNGKTYYEKEDLMKSMEYLNLFEDEKGEEE